MDRSQRVHALDWTRAILIFFVVYAHTAQTLNGLSSGGTDETTVSAARAWCIPMLFWVSGAAASLSPDHLALRPLLLLFLVGILSNAILWLCGPRKSECSALEPCTGKGLLFDFTIAPYSGSIFPIIYQMWYVAALLLFAVLSRPVEIVAREGLHDDGPSGGSVILQAAISGIVYLALGLTSGQPIETLIILVLLELFFVILAAMAAIYSGVRKRLFIYVMCAVAVIQFGLPQIAGAADGGIGEGLIIWFFVFKQHYVVGLVCRGRRYPVAPQVISSAWPVAGLLGMVLLQHPQYAPGGALAYPYPADASTRMGYIVTAFVMALSLDRLSRTVPCAAMHPRLRTAALSAYVLHPWTVSLLCAWGLASEVPSFVEPTLMVSTVALLLCGIPVFLLMAVVSLCCPTGEGEEHADPLEGWRWKGQRGQDSPEESYQSTAFFRPVVCVPTMPDRQTV